MGWEVVSSTFVFLVIGYLVGSLCFAIIVPKMLGLDDVRNKGSGNAGATNIVRNYGKKLGIIVFFLDMLKGLLFLVAIGLLKHQSDYSFLNQMNLQIIAPSVLIGHIFPIFFKFKGGKGVATAMGLALGLEYLSALIAITCFFMIIFAWKKVSLGSILSPGVALITYLIFNFTLGEERWLVPFMYGQAWWSNMLVIIFIWSMIVFKHWPNIKRLIKGEEAAFKKK